jgi:hypothetical protein
MPPSGSADAAARHSALRGYQNAASISSGRPPAEGAARTPCSQLLSSLFEIKTWMGWQSTVSDRYISDPIPFTVSNDFIFSTGFNFTFSL